MERLKRSFVNALEPVNFIITFEHLSTDAIEPFELKNNWTGERLRLTLRHFCGPFCLLVRCPIGREEDKWTNWEKEAIEWEWTRQQNFIDIIFTENSDIGDGILNANEGQRSK
uniref:Uncharacterized protein n=1 Tax=Globodera pallida TaxID=36090 RepID=A0A183BXE0_GLOPA